MRRERTYGRPGAGWWVHQSVLPSAAASRASGRSYRGRRRRPRDLDDVYASDEDASDSGTGSSKPSDPPSPRTEGTLSRSIAPPRRRRSASITDTQSETDSDYSSSGSSFASTSTASALSRSSPDSRTLAPQRSRSRREESMRDPKEEEEEGEVMQDVPQRLEVFQDPFGHWRARGKGERYRGQSVRSTMCRKLNVKCRFSVLGAVVGKFDGHPRRTMFRLGLNDSTHSSPCSPSGRVNAYILDHRHRPFPPEQIRETLFPRPGTQESTERHSRRFYIRYRCWPGYCSLPLRRHSPCYSCYGKRCGRY